MAKSLSVWPAIILICALVLCETGHGVPIASSEPSNTTASASNSSLAPDTLYNSTSPDELIFVYPLSGYYAPLQRALYWVIIAFTILGLGNVWLVAAAFGTAMTYSSVAAVHAIAMYAVAANQAKLSGDAYQYYDADALVICEILFCTSVLLPSWLAHYRRLRSTTAQLVLRLWGLLMFIGGVVAFVQVIKVNANVSVQRNDCLASLAADSEPSSWQVIEWVSSPTVRAACGDWQPYDEAAGALQPMRELDEIVLVRGDTQHRLADWMNRITILGTCGCTFSIFFIVAGFVMPESKTLEKHRRAQLAKLRRTKRNVKGNHPADTIQMPLSWAVGLVTFVFFELTLRLVPVSEQPQAMGQWGPWVAAIFVTLAVLINHYFEAPVEDMVAALGKALGPTVWFVLDWRGKAPSPQEERMRQQARKAAQMKEMREALRRERASRMKTQETQTEEAQEEIGEMAPTVSARPGNLERRFSESDIGMQSLRI